MPTIHNLQKYTRYQYVILKSVTSMGRLLYPNAQQTIVSGIFFNVPLTYSQYMQPLFWRGACHEKALQPIEGAGLYVGSWRQT